MADSVGRRRWGRTETQALAAGALWLFLDAPQPPLPPAPLLTLARLALSQHRDRWAGVARMTCSQALELKDTLGFHLRPLPSEDAPQHVRDTPGD